MSEVIQVSLPRLAREVNISVQQVTTVVRLLDEGNTIPFITRYRRDQTGGLNEEQIESIRDCLVKYRQLEERKQTVLRSIESQGKLTDTLKKQISHLESLKQLEDLYLPFRPKKQSLATKAREQGLGELATAILADSITPADLTTKTTELVSEEKGLADAAAVLTGIGHIIAEGYSERPEVRQAVRKLFHKTGKLLATQVGKDEKKSQRYRDYFSYQEPVDKVPPHRVLAINRGDKEKILRVKIEASSPLIERRAVELLLSEEHSHSQWLKTCVQDMLSRLLNPSMERELRREMTEKAEAHAVKVFGQNLRNLLLQSPLQERRILAIDPGFKNGCKLAALDEFGNLLEHAVIYIIGSEERKAEGRKALIELAEKNNLNAVAIGNGTACRETEELIADLIATDWKDRSIEYVVVNEAGASVYSTSAIGREEFPDCDAMQRSAISIGRRLQDPLSELVKIDPASIGVGLYQHDAKAKHLQVALDEVVRSCVSFVGVEVNCSSAALLRYVSGMNQLTARRVYDYRKEHGPFKNRHELLKVSGFGDATLVQAAGFLKIEHGDTPLDATWIHPENYEAATKLLEKTAIPLSEIGNKETGPKITELTKDLDKAALSAELGIGELTLADIIEALTRPGRDPREDLSTPLFRKDIVKLEDLVEGLELNGTVLNVVDFGAFIDVGLSDSGLVHISQMGNDYIRDPHQIVSVGDLVRVWVATIDKDRRRVSLTMIEPGTERPPEPKKQRPRRSRAKTDKNNPRPANGRKPAAKGSTSGGRSRSSDNNRGRNGANRSKADHSRSFEKKGKKSTVTLSKAKQEGTESLQSFAELLKFSETKTKPKKKK